MKKRLKPMIEGKTYSLLQRLEAITRFLPIFETPGFRFGESRGLEQLKHGVLESPLFVLSEEAVAFVRTCYDYGWIVEFEWGKWTGTREAIILRDNPTALGQSTPEQLEKLLTVCVRQDRYCDGALAGAFDCGFLTAILQRAVVLRDELATTEARKGSKD
ncbi:MAG: DUF6508 domain-containing protein [Candidatus Hydrogenedentales bacterium]|jgi:hypothetical protein